jgi:hypothetical protein
MPLLTTQSAKGYGFGSLVASAAITESYESIQSVTVASGQTYIDFTSIPSTYKHLQIRCTMRRSQAQTFAGSLGVQFNSDTGNNYYTNHRINGRGDGLVYPSGGTVTSYGQIGYIAGNSQRSSLFTPSVVDILEYTSTNKTKVCRGITGSMAQSTNTDNDVAIISSMWNSTAAINNIRLFPVGSDFVTHTVISLYGIKG